MVLDRCGIPFRDRMPRYKPLDTPVPVDLTAVTADELEREVAAGNPFVAQILRESVVLYERTGPAA